MYKFIIKGINGVIKFRSAIEYSKASNAQHWGNILKNNGIMFKHSNIQLSDTVDVIPVNNTDKYKESVFAHLKHQFNC